MSVISVLGGRPHLIKGESVHAALAGTGVRHGTLRISLSTLSDYPNDEDFRLPQPYARLHLDYPGKLADAVSAKVAELRPDVVLIYGDLATSAAVLPAVLALAIPLVHVESGYRSGDLTDPEERARIHISHAASARLSYSRTMTENLLAEDLDPMSIFEVADPARLALLSRLRSSTLAPPIEQRGLVTFHHDETFEHQGRTNRLVAQIERVASVWPLNAVLYERTREMLRKADLLERLQSAVGVTTSPTLSYDSYLSALLASAFVITDSSGVQDDCVTLGRACLVVRRASPRPTHHGLLELAGDEWGCWDLSARITELLQTSQRRPILLARQSALASGLLAALQFAAREDARSAHYAAG